MASLQMRHDLWHAMQASAKIVKAVEPIAPAA